MSDIFEKILNEEVSRFINYAKKSGSYDIIYEEDAPKGATDALVKKDPSDKSDELDKKIRELLKYIPKFVPNESWGNPTSIDRQRVDDLFYWVRHDAQAKGGMEGIKTAFQKIIDLQNNVELGTKRFKKMGGIMRRLILLESLRHMMESYTDSSAGFVFEGFLAALLGGKQHVEKEAGELLITDVTGFADPNQDGDGIDISLKLLSGGKPSSKDVDGNIVKSISPATGIHGSWRNMVVQLNSKGYIVYLIAYKDYIEGSEAAQSLDLGMFNITRDNFLDIMMETGNAAKLVNVKKQNLIALVLDGLLGTDGADPENKKLAEAVLALPNFKPLKDAIQKALDPSNPQQLERSDLAGYLDEILKDYDDKKGGIELLQGLYTLALENGGSMQPGKPNDFMWDDVIHKILTKELPAEDLTATAGGTPDASQASLDSDKTKKDKTQWTISRDYYEKFSGQDYEGRPDAADPDLKRKVRVDPKVRMPDGKPVTSTKALDYFKSLSSDEKAAFMQKHNLSLARGQKAPSKKALQDLFKVDQAAAFRVADSKQWDTRFQYMYIGNVTVNPVKIFDIARYYAKSITDEIVSAFELLAEITRSTNQFFAQNDRGSAAVHAKNAADSADGFEREARGEFGFADDDKSGQSAYAAGYDRIFGKK